MSNFLRSANLTLIAIVLWIGFGISLHKIYLDKLREIT